MQVKFVLITRSFETCQASTYIWASPDCCRKKVGAILENISVAYIWYILILARCLKKKGWEEKAA